MRHLFPSAGGMLPCLPYHSSELTMTRPVPPSCRGVPQLRPRRIVVPLVAAAMMLAGSYAAPLAAQTADPSVHSTASGVASGPTYADLAALADGNPTILRAQIRRIAEVPPERAPGVAANHRRLYVEARTEALLSGRAPVGENLKYLVDVPLNAKGRVPKLKKSQVLLFARTAPGRADEIQLVNPTAQLAWTPELEARLRPIIAAMLAPDAPPRITSIRDALSVDGNLVGESESQFFLNTEGDGPVSLSVLRRPNMAPRWGVSWTEIVDQSAQAPQPETLEWYRLACSLPAELPGQANLSRDPASRARAAQDYAFVLEQLGECRRTR